MYTYQGKLDFYEWAVNENVTLVLPNAMNLGEPVYLCFQWTVVAGGEQKVPMFLATNITSTSSTAKESTFSFGDGYYAYTVTIPSATDGITLAMSSQSQPEPTYNGLAQTYHHPADARTTLALYLGRMKWQRFAIDELFLVVVPRGFADGRHVGGFWEWTVDAAGVPQKNVAYNTQLEDVVVNEDGSGKAAFHGAFYSFAGDIGVGGETYTVIMSNPDQFKSPPMALQLQAPAPPVKYI